MDGNRRPYYTLYASSRRWLLHLIRSTRGDLGLGLPLFDAPFDVLQPVIAGGRVSYLGFKDSDSKRCQYDPASYLHEVVNSHPQQPAAFGVDMRQSAWIRDYIRWDPRTTLVNCDPPLNLVQRAATLLEERPYSSQPDIVRKLLLAMSSGENIPDDFVDMLRTSREHHCQFLNLRELSTEIGDATLLALRNTYFKTLSTDFFPSPAAAAAKFAA